MNLSIFSLIYILNSVYYFLKLDIYKIITLLLISTLLTSLSFKINFFNFQIEYVLYFFLFLSFVIRALFINKKIYIKFDYIILFTLYLILSYPIIKLLYSDLMVWPSGKASLSTSIDANLTHLIKLSKSNTFFTQIFFVLAPLLFFYILKFLNVEKMQHSLRLYIKAIIFICVLNLLIYLALIIFKDISKIDSIVNLLNFGVYRYTSFQSSFVRVSFFLGEPSFASILIIPIIIYYIVNILSYRMKLNLKITLILFILCLNIFLMASSSALISLTLCLLMIIIVNFRSKIIIKLLCIFIFFLILLLISDNIIIENFISKFNMKNKFSSIFVRIWSVEHSLGLLLKSPLLGSSIGTSAATSGLVVFITSVGLIGLYLFARMSNLLNIIKCLYEKNYNKELYVLSNFIISILICNILAGDITTLLTPIYFLLVIMFNYKFQNHDLSR